MKKTILTGLLLLASTSNADIIKCSFAEPYVDTTYSMSQSTLTYVADGETKTIKSVSFQIKAPGVFELVKNGKVLQKLKLTNQGSTGSSNTIYPYEVEDNNISAGVTANNGIGGCVSNSLKSSEGQP